VEDRRLGRSGSGMWQAGTSKVEKPSGSFLDLIVMSHWLGEV
jgi:hypothetical protein